MADACRGPLTCPFPFPGGYRTGEGWTCPSCGAHYVMGRPKPWRWWRNWSAPNGQWKLRGRPTKLPVYGIGS